MHRAFVSGILGVARGISAWILAAVDAGSHSVSDTLYGSATPIVLVWLVAAAVLVATARTMGRP